MKGRFGIKFRVQKDRPFPANTNRGGWLLDPWTEEVRIFGDALAARQFGKLSYPNRTSLSVPWPLFDVFNLDN